MSRRLLQKKCRNRCIRFSLEWGVIRGVVQSFFCMFGSENILDWAHCTVGPCRPNGTAGGDRLGPCAVVPWGMGNPSVDSCEVKRWNGGMSVCVPMLGQLELSTEELDKLRTIFFLCVTWVLERQFFVLGVLFQCGWKRHWGFFLGHWFVHSKVGKREWKNFLKLCVVSRYLLVMRGWGLKNLVWGVAQLR